MFFAHWHLGPEGLGALARQLGFEEREASPPPPPPEPRPEPERRQAPAEPVPAPSLPPESFAPIPFWRLERVEHLEVPPEDLPLPQVSSLRAAELAAFGGEGPRAEPIVPWSRLWPALNRALPAWRPSRTLDLHRFLELWSRGRILRQLPFLPARRSGGRLTVLMDRAERLRPLAGDQTALLSRLLLQRGKSDLRILERNDAFPGRWRDGRGRFFTGLPHFERGERLLAVTDLGFSGTAEHREPWAALGRRVRLQGAVAGALLACPASSWRRPDLRLWTAISWQKPWGSAGKIGRILDPEDREDRVERLLELLSPAVQIEPGLLRAARRLLAPSEADLGTEIDAWNHPSVDGSSWAAAYPDTETATQRRQAFLDLEKETQARLASLLRLWHEEAAPEIWAEEQATLEALGAPIDEVGVRSRERSRTFLLRVAKTLLDPGGTEPQLVTALSQWFVAVWDRVPAALGEDLELGPFLQRAYLVAVERLEEANLPAGVSLRWKARGYSPRLFTLWQEGARLRVLPVGEKTGLIQGGSPLGQLVAGLPVVAVAFESEAFGRPLPLDSDSRRATAVLDLPSLVPAVGSRRLAAPARPPWASAFGQDQFGHWASFEVGEVSHRMRWIPPGTFWMGSPDTEAGRWDDEGPRHQVTLTEGFWLGEVPCTQALWQAVMGENPSRFQGPSRPVESVSWDDCQRFLAKLNGRESATGLRLPTEAEWEYACRAGTETSTYAGELEILEDGEATLLEDISWYRGNSQGETHPVKAKAPNPWGLYETLGNVWEWCADWQGEYAAETVLNPRGPEVGSDRVIRGGSWFDDAGYVRAAARGWNSPVIRYGFLGFRLARGQGAQAGQAGGGRGSGRSRARDEPARPDRRPPAAGLGPTLLLRTDRQELELRRFERPAWASAAGRDRFGLWAAFEVEEVAHRLRWIPPGRFWMGSPETEAGRWDDDGPRHQVTLTEGFWLGEVPCTQALWERVMGENPSRFRTPDRPVERVSWEDCQRFFGELNGRVAGLELSLPTEAEWEYACRAGTETSTYAGELEILGTCNAPLLHDIAWYSGNSGVGYELEEGYDSSEWPEKQFPHTKAGTRPVRLKRPNAWGLYDMLGNVWEWCEDWQGDYAAEEMVNPRGPEMGSNRVFRGGSWDDDAGFVRAAARGWHSPDFRVEYLGFRLARGQVRPAGGRSPGETEAREPVEPGEGRAGATEPPGLAAPRERERVR
ncbi:MAG TPA: formylglycine-generating enzyme family protein [Thermoanaerobaculia bacterium]|nr:formylglycine-generating enzyme family protein [Thermoanaerobaculia bacterium]